MDIQKVYTLLTIFGGTNPNRYRDYYGIETQMLYKYLVDNNILKRNQNILEVGCGGGIFYEEYKPYLKGLKNKYTCIDIDKPSIKISKQNVDYVNFKCLDIHDYPINELVKHDVILMVQTYICVPNINKVIKQYFKQKPNGKIIIMNSIVPEYLIGISNFGRDFIAKGWFGVDWGKALTLDYIMKMSKRINRNLRYKIVGQSPISGHDEYIMIIE